MGLKENFSQAVKELTGGGKSEPKQPEKRGVPVSDLQRALADEQPLREESVLQTQPPVREVAEEELAEPVKQSKLPEIRLDEVSTEQLKPAEPKNEAPAENSPLIYPYAAEQNMTAQSEPVREKEPSQQGYGGYQIPVTPQRPLKPAIPYAGYGEAQNDNSNVHLRNYRAGDDETTVISKNTVIDGNIRSFANMSIDGDIKGDIETTKNIDLNGKIIGNITCNNAEMHSSQIQGNIRMKGNVEMERDTLLIGDLVSTYAKVNGKVKGNLDISGKAELKGDAVVFGDISASTITIDDGAIVQGYVSTTFLNKEESRNIFPDTITISE